ncbi:MAG: tetratricopeptide repeat protein, partial [Planctomycetes bacterium]|nr:tetratricopeptide repeat protein [Planctomycetota bacterium]
KAAEAEPYYKEALERSRGLKDEPNQVMINMLGAMGTLKNEQGKFEEAEKFGREALELNREAHGNDHQDTLASMGNLATALKAQGKLAEAEPLMRETLERRRKLLGQDHPQTLVAMSELEVLLQAQGKLEEAEPLCREALEKQLKIFGYESLDTMISVNSLGGLLIAQKKYGEAVSVMAPGQDAARKTLDGTARLHRYLLNLGKARAGVGQFASAEGTLIEAQARAVKVRGATHKDTKACEQALVDLYVAWEKSEPGKGHAGKAAEWRATFDASPPPPSVDKK